MTFTQTSSVLTHEGALAMLEAAVACAEAIAQPQCIVIVDASGEVVAELRMTGAKFLSRRSARAKALTAASTRGPSDTVPEAVRGAIGLATAGGMTGLPGGLPIVTAGQHLGGVGVGSGSPAQDLEVARAALAAIGAEV